jgi:hypothetical protein
MVFNEKANVDSKFDCVADIVPGNENVRIKVRVIKMWKVAGFLNSSEVNLLEMVLVDEKVSVILNISILFVSSECLFHYVAIYIFQSS